MNESLLSNALALHRAGRLAEAARLYSDILQTEPAHKDALYLLALTHMQRGDFSAALEIYDRLLAAVPQMAEAHAARGAALSNLARHDEALTAYDRAVALNPNLAVAWNHRGNALLERGRNAEALQSYDRSITIRPDIAEVWRHRAVALMQLGRHADALESLDKAIVLSPDDASAFQERGNLLMQFNRHADAVADFGRALAVRPDDPDLLYSRGNTHSILKNYTEAIRDCTRLLQIQPDYPYARGVLVHSKLQCCDWTGLDDQRREISLGIAQSKRVVSPFNHKALSDSPEEQWQCARAWTAHECPPAAPLWHGESYKHDRIRLAYVSADFNNTAVAMLMAGVFERHDRTRFEPIAVSFGPDSPTSMRARLIAAFEGFHEVREKSDQDIAILLHALEIDIAVDLMGFTGACRPRIFAARPAPLQVNFVGFPGTMGAAYMDYIVADRIVIPAADAAYYSEKIVYLPDCYQPNDDRRRVADRVPTRSEAGLPEHGFVFCCFNNSYKIMPDVFDIWMRLLRTTPGSVLWLLADNGFAAESLKREAAARGVAPERLVFASRVTPEEHLARHRLADLFLDTLPYNAHTTASDALWMGLPLVTCPGKAFPSRVAASLLTAAKVPELIADSLEGYEDIALKLAREPNTLTALKAKLARNRDTCALFDTARFTHNLEAAYTGMWERHRRGASPESFALGDAP